MLWLWNFLLEKRQFSYVLIATLLVAGTYSIIEIPKENTPSIVIPYGVVTAVFPGASASDVETLVTDKLEAQAANLDNVHTITSTSGDGISSVVVQFDANADTNQSIQNLRDAIDKAVPELPSDVKAPQVSKINLNDQPMLVVSIYGQLTPSEFSRIGKEVSDQIKSISGISRVDVSGVPDRQVTVIVRKEALEQYGIGITDVISAISSSNAALPAGNITMNGVNYTVNFKGGLTDPAQIQNIAVTSRGGVTVYLRDVAVIDNGLAPESTYSRVSEAGKPSNQAMTLLIYKQSSGNMVGLSNKVKDKLKELQGSTLEGLSVLVAPSTDQGAQVGQQLGDLVKTGMETVVLVIAALLLTIGWRESVVAALSIPFSFLIAFIGLHLTGNSLNFISLFSLILAVGILVDSGIVVTEAIHARMRLHPTPLRAAQAALHDYSWPLIAGTMATVAVFAPLFFISGIIGQFIAGIPYTLIFVLLASIFVALGIVPIIALMFTKSEPNRLEKIQEEYTEKVTHWYKGVLRSLLENPRHQKIFIRSLGALFVVSLILPISGYVEAIFFPVTDEDYVYVNIKKPQGTTLAQTDLAVREVEELLYDEPDVDSFITTVGQSSSLSGSGSSGSNQGNITINLSEDRKRTSIKIASDLSRKLATIKDADVQVMQAANGPSSGAPIQIQFIGDDLDQLIIAADKGKQLLASNPHVKNISASTADNGTEFDLAIDRGKASALGLNTTAVAQTLRAAVNGTKATSIIQPDENIDVVVKLNLNTAFTGASDAAHTTIDSIKNMTVQGSQGPVLLGTVINDSLGVSNSSISHKDRKRIQTVSGYPDDQTTTAKAVKEFQSRVAELKLPPGITISYGGESEDINTSFKEMLLALIAGLVGMFMILVISFNSIRYTLYLLMIVPLSLIGVLDGLALTGQTLSFPSMLGFIALGGVIINHAIILMDSMIHYEATSPERPLIDVIVDAAATRLRPIALTTITTVIGMVPLVRTGGMWGPLAFTIMFGLTFAIVLTLALVPVLYYRAPRAPRDPAESQ